MRLLYDNFASKIYPGIDKEYQGRILSVVPLFHRQQHRFRGHHDGHEGKYSYSLVYSQKVHEISHPLIKPRTCANDMTPYGACNLHRDLLV